MNNNELSARLTTPVDSKIEVRICREMWERIRWVAESRECSYSWVVRYAVFRLIKRVDPKKCVSYIGNPRLCGPFEGGLNERAWARRAGASLSGAGAKHRHQLCLYGEDELAIRYAAAHYGCTMTHLIRVALELYFERVYATMVRSNSCAYNIGHAPLACKRPGEMTYFQRAFWFWLGIKVFRGAEFRSRTLSKRVIEFRRYCRVEYYGKRYAIPIAPCGGVGRR